MLKESTDRPVSPKNAVSLTRKEHRKGIGRDGRTISLRPLRSLRGHVVANCLANTIEHWINLDNISALWDAKCRI
eukprot:s462_g25.t1